MLKNVSDKQVERMYNLFRGLRCAYGTYDMSQAFLEGKKLRGIPKSILESTTEIIFDQKFWLQKVRDHLTSNEGLGIVPIDEESNCYWGCIDVDKYDLNYEEVLRRLAKYELPFVVTVSKSGGLHMWLFLKTPVKAFLLINYLKNAKAQIGLADSEVFPKQTKILFEKGDSGSWVNLPMLGDGTRYAIRLKDEQVEEIKDLEVFLEYAESKRLDKLNSTEITFVKQQAVDETDFKEAPPCLQSLMAEGFPEGSRNTIMYNIGVYLKKAYGELWENEFEKFNQMYCEPQLTASEVISLQKSVNKKDYKYQCSLQPLCSYCNVSKCKIAKFGLGNSSMELQIESLAKLDAIPALWFATVGDMRMELTTEQLHDQKKFQLCCMEKLNRFPPKLKDNDWATLIDSLIQDAVLIPAPPDVGYDGQFMVHLEDFCTRMAGYDRQDVLRGKAYINKPEGFTYFALVDFVTFLKKKGFTVYRHTEISNKIKSLGGGSKGINILGKCKNTHYIPSFPEQESQFAVKDFQDEEEIC
jgi:hypothetical protein